MVSRSKHVWKRIWFWSCVVLFCHSPIGMAQTTAFTYQGKLTDTGNLANGNYDFQFKLFDTPALGTGNQQGATVLATNVTVSNGIFTATLDFGACASCFNGSTRYLEIAVKLTSNVNFTTLAPRQQITSTPYAVRSLNATAADGLSVACVNCVTSSQIGSVNGSAVTGTIPVASVPAGSANYIQNTTNQQATSNFNISGNGTVAGTLSANLVNTATQYNLGGLRVFSVNGPINDGTTIFTATNSFIGDGAGLNTNPNPDPLDQLGKFNSFFGAGAGLSNTTGLGNAFFGFQSGFSNTIGQRDSFFGPLAGQANTTGFNNSFFGTAAGSANTTGNNNSFFGAFAGESNISDNNAFFGVEAGDANTTGNNNSFFGMEAGRFNNTGIANAFFGYQSGFSNTTGGTNSFFGNVAGKNNTNGSQNSFFGHAAGISNTTGTNNTFIGALVANSHTTGGNNTFLGAGAGTASTTGNNNTFIGSNAGNLNLATQVNNSTVIGANAAVSQSNAIILGSINGINGATADTSIGIGTTAPQAKLHVSGGAILMDNGQGFFLKNNSNTQKRVLLADGANILHLGSGGGLGFDQIRFDLGTPGTVMTLLVSGNVGIGTTAPDQLLTVNGNASKSVGGTTWAVFSDERLKIIKGQFTAGLSTLLQLQPIRYEYKADNALGLKSYGEAVGFSAQAVEKVLPEAVSRTSSGYLQLNSDQILWTMLNAIKEQQQQIELLRTQVRQLEALKKLVCQTNPQAAACQEQ